MFQSGQVEKSKMSQLWKTSVEKGKRMRMWRREIWFNSEKVMCIKFSATLAHTGWSTDEARVGKTTHITPFSGLQQNINTKVRMFFPPTFHTILKISHRVTLSPYNSFAKKKEVPPPLFTSLFIPLWTNNCAVGVMCDFLKNGSIPWLFHNHKYVVVKTRRRMREYRKSAKKWRTKHWKDR